MSEAKWYVVHTYSGYENKVKTDLEKTIKNKKDLNKMFCQIFTDIPLSQIKGGEYECYKQCESKNL